MSTQQNLVTVEQVRSTQQSGKVEFVTRGVLIQPDRYTFANLDELTAYVGEIFGGQPEGRGLRGSVTRKGAYARRAADGTEAVTFSDPVLDAVSSATGTIVIGTQTIDLREDQGSPESVNTAGGGAVAFDSPGFAYTGDVNGAERWAADDGSLVEYRMGTGRLAFHAWNRRRTFPPYWSAGSKIFITSTTADFEFADITSHYYMSVTSPCELVKADADSDRDDSYLEEYEWGFNAQRPERVASLCRAQWHHLQFADLVTAGEGCLRYLDDDWPLGFPPEWTPISTVLELTGLWTDGSAQRAAISRGPRSLTIDMSDFDRSAAHGSIVDYSTIEVTFPDDAAYTGTLESNRIRWSNGSTWTKVVSTVLDVNGRWTDGSARRAIISEGIKNLTIDMSDFDRPAAQGSVIDGSTIRVKFPGDTTHTGTLESPNRIRWSNGSTWTKV